MRQLAIAFVAIGLFCVSGGSAAVSQEKAITIGQWSPVGNCWPDVVAEKKDFYDSARKPLQALSKVTASWCDPGNKAEAIEVLPRATKLDPDLVSETCDYYHGIHDCNKDLGASRPSIEKTLRFMTEYGQISAETAFEKIVDTSIKG